MQIVSRFYTNMIALITSNKQLTSIQCLYTVNIPMAERRSMLLLINAACASSFCTHHHITMMTSQSSQLMLAAKHSFWWTSATAHSFYCESALIHKPNPKQYVACGEIGHFLCSVISQGKVVALDRWGGKWNHLSMTHRLATNYAKKLL